METMCLFSCLRTRTRVAEDSGGVITRDEEAGKRQKAASPAAARDDVSNNIPAANEQDSLLLGKWKLISADNLFAYSAAMSNTSAAAHYTQLMIKDRPVLFFMLIPADLHPHNDSVQAVYIYYSTT
jgi:hypothetical protein